MTIAHLSIIVVCIFLLITAAMASYIVMWGRNGKQMGPIEWLPMMLLFAAGAVVNMVVVFIVLCWDRLRGKPPTAPPNQPVR